MVRDEDNVVFYPLFDDQVYMGESLGKLDVFVTRPPLDEKVLVSLFVAADDKVVLFWKPFAQGSYDRTQLFHATLFGGSKAQR